MTEHKQGTLLRVRDKAQAVVDRWNSPDWSDGKHTSELIKELKAELMGLDKWIASVPDEPVKKEKPDWEYVNSLHDYLCTMSEILSEAVREE